MLVVWILVIGEFRLSLWKFEVSPRLRFIIGLGLLLLMFYQLGESYHGFVLWSREMWELVGETMYATLGCFMVYAYYRRYRYPEVTENDWRNQSVLKPDQKKMGRQYLWLVLRLLGLFIALISLSPQ